MIPRGRIVQRIYGRNESLPSPTNLPDRSARAGGDTAQRRSTACRCCCFTSINTFPNIPIPYGNLAVGFTGRTRYTATYSHMDVCIYQLRVSSSASEFHTVRIFQPRAPHCYLHALFQLCLTTTSAQLPKGSEKALPFSKPNL